MMQLGYIESRIYIYFMEITARIIAFCFHCFGAWIAYGGVYCMFSNAVKTYNIFQSKSPTIINNLCSISGFLIPYFLVWMFIAYYLVVLRVIVEKNTFEFIFYNKITRSTIFSYLIIFVVITAVICIFLSMPLNILASKYKYK